MGEDDVRAALVAASMLLDRLRLRNAPLPAWLVQHHQRMRIMSATGHQNCSDTAQSEQIGVSEAGHIIGISTRHVRRIATDLYGIQVGTTWVFDRATVEEYAQERREQ